MDINFASLGQMGLSEDQMQALFTSRGIKLNNNDLRASRSMKSLPKNKKSSKTKKAGSGGLNELNNQRSEIEMEIDNARRQGNKSKVSVLLKKMIDAESQGSLKQRMLMIDYSLSLIDMGSLSEL